MKRRLRLAAGLALGFFLPLILGEALLRFHPPTDLHPFLGEESPLRGIYRGDRELGADYVRAEAFRAEYRERLEKIGPPGGTRPIWIFFGNSFVQAPGMLAETAQAGLPNVRVVHLGRNEPVHLRVAQARLLLAEGWRPERIIFTLLPIDLAPYMRQPLGWIDVNQKGAATMRVRRAPAPLDVLIRQSRLALTAWVRSGLHVANPFSRKSDLTENVPPQLREDMKTLLSALAESARSHDVPVTLLLLPNREQVFGSANYAPQEMLANVARDAGLDLLDARDAFANVPDRRGIFMPDWHFNPEGNRVLLRRLLEHLGATSENASIGGEGGR